MFEIDADPEQMEELRLRVGSQLDKSDLVDFFPIDRRQPKRRLFWQRDPSPPANVIVV